MREESPTRRAVREMHAAGLPVRKIADYLGISTQRVYQQVARLREIERREKSA